MSSSASKIGGDEDVAAQLDGADKTPPKAKRASFVAKVMAFCRAEGEGALKKHARELVPGSPRSASDAHDD